MSRSPYADDLDILHRALCGGDKTPAEQRAMARKLSVLSMQVRKMELAYGETALFDLARTAGFTMPAPTRPGLPDDVVAVLIEAHHRAVDSAWRAMGDALSREFLLQILEGARRIRAALKAAGHQAEADALLKTMLKAFEAAALTGLVRAIFDRDKP